MHIYRLRAGVRVPPGQIISPVLDKQIYAADDRDAQKQAKVFQIDQFIGAGDFAWLTDTTGHVVWSLKWEEA